VTHRRIALTENALRYDRLVHFLVETLFRYDNEPVGARAAPIRYADRYATDARLVLRSVSNRMAPRRKRITPVGEQLRAVREQLGCTQRDFGALMYVSERTVSRWENGQPPTEKEEKRLLDVCLRHSAALHDQVAVALGYELEENAPPAAPAPAPVAPEPVAPRAVLAPVAPPPSLEEAVATRASDPALRAAFDAVVYGACEEHDVSPRALRSFGAALVRALKTHGVAHEDAIALLASPRK
jgi:transcriptional regulator with XRE-family HTH domain